MTAEVLYKRMYPWRIKVAEYFFVYLVSFVMGFVNDLGVLDDKSKWWDKMTDIHNPAVVILVFLTIITVLFYLLLAILGYFARKQNISSAFAELMLAHTDEFARPDIYGGFSWGQNRAMWHAPNIILGLDPRAVMVDYNNKVEYEFEGELKAAFQAFEKSAYMEDIRKKGNNLPRFMVTRYGSNFNKELPMFTLQLRKTDWGHCQFVWNRYKGEKNAEEKRILWHHSIISEHLGHSPLQVVNYPNSFCLHLVIETSDGQVLITVISEEKENDYPKSKAVSLGEQIELADFLGPQDYQADFVTEWTRRAVCEEFGITSSQFDEEFDVKSLRVLSFDMEMDCYNFALVCTIKMRHSCEQFKKVVNLTIEQKEISNMFALPLSEIPGILLDYPKNKKEYHPSSYLRLLMFYLYKNGYRRTCERFCKKR